MSDAVLSITRTWVNDRPGRLCRGCGKVGSPGDVRYDVTIGGQGGALRHPIFIVLCSPCAVAVGVGLLEMEVGG